MRTLPKVRMEFSAILKETLKAYCFKGFDGKEFWVAKYQIGLMKIKKDRIVLTISADKYEEITGEEVEPLNSAFIPIGGEPLPRHRVDAELYESEHVPLLPAQREQLQRAVKCRHNFLFWEAGAGKTLAALTLANSYWRSGLTDKVIVLSPASLVGQWKREQERAFPEMSSVITVLSIESNSFEKSFPKTLQKFVTAQGRKHLIIDESHMIKNIGANRTRNIDANYNAEYVTCLTGTPIGRSTADLYFQFSIADRGIIGYPSYGSFSKQFLLYGGTEGDKVVAYKNTKELSERISPYIYFLKRDDIRGDMPKKHYIKVYYEMTDVQKQAHRALQSFANYIFGTKNYVAKEKAYQITSALQKLACGFEPSEQELNEIYKNLGAYGAGSENLAKIKHIGFNETNNRVKEVLKIVEKIDDRAIVWCSYIAELEAMSQAIKDSRVLKGGMSSKEIMKVIDDFRDGKFKVLVAMQQMGTGFDLPFVNHAIYSTTIFDWIKRTQSEDRIYRINREGDCYIYDVIAKDSIDERIQEVLRYKQDVTAIFKKEKEWVQ